MSHPPAPASTGHGHTPATCARIFCDGCMYCDGGLWACTVCGGVEGSMPTHCPGDRMDDDTLDAVNDELLDYRDGQWIETGQAAQATA